MYRLNLKVSDKKRVYFNPTDTVIIPELKTITQYELSEHCNLKEFIICNVYGWQTSVKAIVALLL